MLLCHRCGTVMVGAADYWYTFHDHCLEEHLAVIQSDPGSLVCTNLFASPDALLSVDEH